jgi:hypothetical protein
MTKLLSILLGLVVALSPAITDAKKNKTQKTTPESALLPAPASGRVDATKSSIAPIDKSEPAEPLDDDASAALGEDPIGGTQKSGLRMLLQARYMSTVPDTSQISPNPRIAELQRGTAKANDGFDIQRAFLRYVATPTKNVEAKFLVDFAELQHNNVKQSFKLAYVELHATRRLQIDFGLLKRTYSLLELLPIAKHELADLGPTDNFIKDQAFGGRDVGVVARYQPLPTRKMMTISVGTFRGDIDEGFDASPLKLLTARIETHPVKHLRLGVNAVFRPYDNVKMLKTKVDDGNGGTDTIYVKTVMLKKGAAAGTDATLSYRHLEIRGELLLGKSTDNIDAVYPRVTEGSFWAAWLVVAPRIEVGKVLFVPAAKAEVLDTDALNPNGQRRTVSGVLGVVPMNGVRIIVDVTRTWADPHLLDMSKVPWTTGVHKVWVLEPSWTSATLQAQVVF